MPILVSIIVLTCILSDLCLQVQEIAGHHFFAFQAWSIFMYKSIVFSSHLSAIWSISVEQNLMPLLISFQWQHALFHKGNPYSAKNGFWS